MKIFLSKKGSFAIFATMLFISSVTALWLIINAAGNLAIGSTVNSFGTLWGKSILSEYDLYLRDRYGLMAYYGDEQSVEEKIKKYAEYSFDSKKYIEIQGIECCLDEYSLEDTEELLKQIEYIALEGTKPVPTVLDEEITTERVITSSWIKDNLPSHGKTESSYVVGLANSIKDGIKVESLITNAAIDKYVFDFFKDYMEDRDLGKTYFNCEIEYIICGEFSDVSLKSHTDDKIVILRNILNLYYLYTCQEKRDGAMAIAASLTPGAMSFITQAVLLEAWSFAEAKNDMKLLNDNKAVALLKDDSNWALTIENVFKPQEDLQGNTSDSLTAEEIIKEEPSGYILPESEEGSKYQDYLRILLCGVPERTKLLRILDLIQINMKYIYCDYFLIRDYNLGFAYSIKINGIAYEFKDKYIEGE